MKQNYFPVIENKKTGKLESIMVWAANFEAAVELVFKSLVRGERFLTIRHPETLEVIRYL